MRLLVMNVKEVMLIVLATFPKVPLICTKYELVSLSEICKSKYLGEFRPYVLMLANETLSLVIL